MPAQRDGLLAHIRADSALAADIAAFPASPWSRRLDVIKRVMALECEVNGVTTPPLVIHDEDDSGREAFFEFDPDKPSTGIVHLWPKSLATEPSPYAALLFAVHETRHSWQFQTAFGTSPQSGDVVLRSGFAAGFRAQKALSHRLGFCDFCTMQHEHEAFQTGNYIVGALTGWSVKTEGMGCWSSQFDASGRLRIDLKALASQVGSAQLLSAFNEKEKGQFVEMGGTAP